MDMMEVSPALIVDRVLQTGQSQNMLEAQYGLLKDAMAIEESAAMALLNGLPTDLPLATDGAVGTQVNTMV